MKHAWVTALAVMCGIAASDTMPPLIHRIFPPDTSVLGGPAVEMLIVAVDNTGVAGVDVNGAPASPRGSNSWTYTMQLSPGENHCAVEARDAAGNIASETVSYYRGATNMPDTMPPVIFRVTPWSGKNPPGPTVEMCITAYDNVGVTRVTVGGDEAAYAGSNKWMYTAQLAHGDTELDVMAGDAAGNTAIERVRYGHSMTNGGDTIPPVIDDVAPSSGVTTTNASLLVSVRAHDNNAIASVVIQGAVAQPVQGVPGAWSAPVSLAPGDNAVNVVASDPAGNTAHALAVYKRVPPGYFPEIATTNLPPATLERAYFHLLQPRGGLPPYTWRVDGLPPGLAVSNNLIHGQPVETGVFMVAVHLTDARWMHAHAVLKLTVAPYLRITTIELPDAIEGLPYSYRLDAEGAESSASLVWAASPTLPDGIELLKNGQFDGEPVSTGSHDFTVTVTDPKGRSITQPYMIDVLPPTSVGDVLSMTLPEVTDGEKCEVKLPVNTADGEPGMAAMSLYGMAIGGMKLLGDGILSGIPVAGVHVIPVASRGVPGAPERSLFWFVADKRADTMDGLGVSRVRVRNSAGKATITFAGRSAWPGSQTFERGTPVVIELGGVMAAVPDGEPGRKARSYTARVNTHGMTGVIRLRLAARTGTLTWSAKLSGDDALTRRLLMYSASTGVGRTVCGKIMVGGELAHFKAAVSCGGANAQAVIRP
ncbi:hypothetical protein GX586_11375 [bacterium]|nr:hypothetical protein [bacterium]